MPNKSGVAEQVLPLPKGGGAIKGIGEKFQPDPHTGTANFSVPIALPPGRNGFQPQISLAYSTGTGNGPFGLGWSLSVPGVTLKTAKGIPRYQGDDTYILSGAEDLVLLPEEAVPGIAGPHYRPRAEGLFARILHITADGADHWEVTSKSGITSIYGRDAAGRVYDADHPDHIFQWLLCETRDLNNNRIVYTYKREDRAGLDNQPYEENRAYNQLYLAKVEYVSYPTGTGTQFLFSVEFDYGEYDEQGRPVGAWAYRPDPFSTYRAGFEIRTARRCRRILIKVHQRDGADSGQMIKAYRLRYFDELSAAERGELLPLNGVSLLAEIVLAGYRDRAQLAFPPLSFRYTRFEPEQRSYETFTAEGDYMPERALNQPDYELVDLHGYGLPDVLQTMPEGARYWRNLGNCRFAFPQPMQRFPTGVTLADSGVQLADMDGTGSADLLVTKGSLAGFYPTLFDARWDAATLVKYRQAPSFSLEDPDVKLVDMDGDGVVDALQTGYPHFVIWYNRGRNGWDPEGRHIPRGQPEQFPDVAFSAPDQRVRLAAMNGGLQDIVSIHDRQIQYWPSLGYGNWGRRITMRNPPRLPHHYDPRRLFLADIDGDGYADLVYVDFGCIHYWINQSGNAWSAEQVIEGTPAISDADAVRIADMKGDGTAGILWSSDYSTRNRGNYKYLDLTGGVKPYLLNRMDNHIGAVTTASYAPSTKFVVADWEQGQPWLTHLPFPVQVVERVIVDDQVSRGRLVTRYAYHAGSWDSVEREFCGFGCVEQFDSETFERFRDPALHGDGKELAAHFSPPTLIRTWFHQGVDADAWGCTLDLERLYLLPPNLTPGERREALRTLRGSILRTDLYALDDSAWAQKPYTVTENRYRVELVARNPAHNGDPRLPSGVFFPHLHETITRQFERGDEPRTNRALTFYDTFGNITREIALGEPRQPSQLADLLILVTDTVFALGHRPTDYIKDRVAETMAYDLALADRQHILAYLQGGPEPEWSQLGTSDSTPLGHTRHYYDGEAYQGRPLGQVERGNLVRSEALVLTQNILAAAYPAPPVGAYPAPPAALANLATHHYRQDSQGYWVDTARKRYDLHDPAVEAQYGLVIGLKDPDGNETTFSFDRPYFLFPAAVTNPLAHTTLAEYDYQALAPRLLIDLNQNETEYAYNPLGMLTGVAVKGKPEGSGWQGDRIEEPSILYTYNLSSFVDAQQPIHVITYQRTEHKTLDFFVSYAYFDSFGRAIQQKAQAEPVNSDDPVRWIGSGWQVYNNKGWVVKKYEPFFSSTSNYEREARHGACVTVRYDPLGRAVRTINPDGSFQRVVYGHPADVSKPDTAQPSPWEAYFYDENDNGAYTYDGAGDCIDRPAAELEALRIGGRPAVSGRPALASHLMTPRKEVYDAWGRKVEVHEDNGALDGTRHVYVTRYAYDTLGRLITVTDAKERPAFQHVYDLAGNRLRLVQLDAGVRITVFDAAGNVVEAGDSKGARVITSYDALHRPLEIRARDSANALLTLREHCCYDWNLAIGEQYALRDNTLGRLVQSYDGAGKLNIEAYDFKGNPLRKTRRVLKDEIVQAQWPETSDGERDRLLDAGPGYGIQTRYDALNRVTAVISPDGRELRYMYNRSSLLEQVSFGDQPYITNIDYNPRGQRELIVYASGVATTYTYDPKTFRLVALVTRKGGGPALQDLVYHYDLTGNIVRIEDRAQTRMENGRPYIADPRDYWYDPLYRLVSATGNELKNIANRFRPPQQDAPFIPAAADVNQHQPYQRWYSYDEVGNILVEQSALVHNQWTNSYSYSSDTNRLARTSRGAETDLYRYDANGNLAGLHTNWRYAWDYADRMIGAEDRPQNAADPTMAATYAYDSAGMRVRKVVRKGNRTETTVSIDGLFEEYTARAGNDVREQKRFAHILDGDHRIAIVKTVVISAEPDAEPPVLYQHGDYLGSSQVVTDASGTFYNQEEFYPYGETSFGSYAKKRYRFTGKERDEESGLYYHGARYYMPWIGRWTSCDPAGMVDSTNLYVYAIGNPIRFFDKTGSQTETRPLEAHAVPEKKAQAHPGTSKPPTPANLTPKPTGKEATKTIVNIKPGLPKKQYPAQLNVNADLIDELTSLQRDKVNPEATDRVMERAGIVTRSGKLVSLSRMEHLEWAGSDRKAEESSPGTSKVVSTLLEKGRLDPSEAAIGVHTHPSKNSPPSTADMADAARKLEATNAYSKSLVVSSDKFYLLIPTKETQDIEQKLAAKGIDIRELFEQAFGSYQAKSQIGEDAGAFFSRGRTEASKAAIDAGKLVLYTYSAENGVFVRVQ